MIDILKLYGKILFNITA